MDIEKIETVVARHDEQIKQHDKDIIDLKDTTKVLHEMNTNIKILAMQGTTQTEKIESIENKVGKLDNKVEKMDITIEEIKCKPNEEDAKKWRDTIKYITTAILGAVIALVLKQIGLI